MITRRASVFTIAAMAVSLATRSGSRAAEFETTWPDAPYRGQTMLLGEGEMRARIAHLSGADQAAVLSLINRKSGGSLAAAISPRAAMAILGINIRSLRRAFWFRISHDRSVRRFRVRRRR